MDIAELSDIQSESGVIGTLIFHPEYILHSDTFLKAGHFYNVENGCVYWAIQELIKEGINNIDALNLSNKLNSNTGVKNTIEKYNLPSVQEFVELYKELARHSLEEYMMLAKNITEFAFKRDLYKKLIGLSGKCFDKNISLDELSGEVYGELDNVTADFICGSDVKLLGDEIDDIWHEIESRRTNDGMYGIPSKFKSFNHHFTYETGELVVIQAKYKEGKSIILMNEVVHKLKNGVPVLVVDTEMQTRLYVERLLAHLSCVDIEKVKNGKYNEEEERRIKQSIAWIKKQKFKHIYKPEMSDNELYTTCKLWINKMGIKFLVFDYLKSNESETGTNYNVLGAKCDFLKNKIAGELNLAVLAACQLNRQGEVADSIKINRYLSVGIKYGQKTQEQMVKDGAECGNAYAKIYVNRLGKQMREDDENDYIDLYFDGDKMTISEVKQHDKQKNF